MASKSAVPSLRIRKAVGLVARMPNVLGVVKDNILMSRPTASDQDILAAAKLSGVEEFISGHHLVRSAVGERGSHCLEANVRRSRWPVRSSTFARAVPGRSRRPQWMHYRAHDDRAPRGGARSDQTLILSTHRHSTLSLVNRLVVIDRGAIIAMGRRIKSCRARAAARRKSAGRADAVVARDSTCPSL